MRRITRYVLAEFLKVFCVALALLSTVILVGVVAVEAILREGLAPSSVLRLLPYSLPIALLYAIPGTTLFAVCSIYGRMSAANEITAIKAAGISPLKMLLPVLVLSVLMSLFVVWLNDVAVSWGRMGFQRVVLESVEQIAYSMLRTHRSYTTPRFSINVRGVEGEKLINPTVIVRMNDSGPPMVFVAEEAQLKCDPARETLKIVLHDCEIDWGDYHGEDPNVIEHEIPLTAATRKGTSFNRPADMALARIPHEMAEQQRQIEELKRGFALEAAMQYLSGDQAALTSGDWGAQYEMIRSCQMRLHRLHTEPWRRVANGFSCFCFALVGAPLAIRLRNADVWSSFGMCFLPILVAYYPLMIYGVDVAKSGAWPPHCVWLGNLVLIAVGYWQIRRIQRY